MSAEEPAPLETGWLATTPVSDSVTRRFVVSFAEWIAASGAAATLLPPAHKERTTGYEGAPPRLI